MEGEREERPYLSKAFAPASSFFFRPSLPELLFEGRRRATTWLANTSANGASAKSSSMPPRTAPGACSVTRTSTFHAIVRTSELVDSHAHCSSFGIKAVSRTCAHGCLNRKLQAGEYRVSVPARVPVSCVCVLAAVPGSCVCVLAGMLDTPT